MSINGYSNVNTRLLIPFLMLAGMLLIPAPELSAQVFDTTSFNQPIMLDEVVIRAKDSGFNIKKFIDLIKNDTTFYKAFKSMHLKTYDAVNNIKVYNKKGTKIMASQKAETKQIYRDGCRTMNTLFEKTTGNFYKSNGDYRYYTAKLYADLFYTKGKVCGENNIVKGTLEKEEADGNTLHKRIVQLKYLMFMPGRPVPKVPFVGQKVAIFNPEIAKMYRFKLVVDNKNGVPCYLFAATPKPKYRDKVVIKTFKTWLRQSDYAIMARDYALSYKNLAFNFNVRIKVNLSKIKAELLPTYISYDGYWKIIFKKPENVTFTADFEYY